ncbi:MAG: hypothetical protein K2G14_03915 [Ruminococcus sp.]|nr:hypothetical protein [Ruminococcus sp.]
MPETSEEWLSFLEEYHLTEIYADVYQVAKLLTDYDNVKSINLDNISHDDAEYTKGTVQVEYDE